jgi:hypothetical protein
MIDDPFPIQPNGGISKGTLKFHIDNGATGVVAAAVVGGGVIGVASILVLPSIHPFIGQGKGIPIPQDMSRNEGSSRTSIMTGLLGGSLDD